MKERDVKSVVLDIFSKWRDWLSHYDEWKGDNWFRKKWVTPELEKTYDFKNKQLILKLAKDMYYAGSTFEHKPEWCDLSLEDSANWVLKAVVLVNKYNITEKPTKE